MPITHYQYHPAIPAPINPPILSWLGVGLGQFSRPAHQPLEIDRCVSDLLDANVYIFWIVDGSRMDVTMNIDLAASVSMQERRRVQRIVRANHRETIIGKVAPRHHLLEVLPIEANILVIVVAEGQALLAIKARENAL